MKKLLGLLAATGLVATTSATVTACAASGEVKSDKTEVKAVGEKIKLNITLKSEPKTDDKWDIKSDATTSHLTIPTTPTKDGDSKTKFVLELTVKTLPTDKDVKEKITIKHADKAVGKAITITIKKGDPATLKKLSDVVKVTALGELGAGGDVQPTDDEIIAGINKANGEAKLAKADIVISEQSKTGATIKPADKSTKYEGEVKVTFTTNAKKTLSDVVKKTVLGELGAGAGAQPTDDEIIAGINALVENTEKLAKADIVISEQSKTEATIKPADKSTKYQGEVKVTFTTKA